MRRDSREDLTGRENPIHHLGGKGGWHPMEAPGSLIERN